MRRLITSLLTLFLVIVLTFFLMQIVPGGPFLGENVNPEVTQKLLEKYGYDQPIMVQFGNYMRGLFQGDMGVSMVVKSGDPVTGVIADHFPVSCKLGLIALALAVFIGIPLGVFAAMSRVRTRRLTISLWQVSENSPPNRTYTSRCIRLSRCQSNFPACNLS